MEEISRREALKRGAKIGVGVLWATPAVQAVSMVRSAAAATSPTPDEPTYHLVAVSDEGDCKDLWDQFRGCIDPTDLPMTIHPGGCDRIRARRVQIRLNEDGSPDAAGLDAAGLAADSFDLNSFGLNHGGTSGLSVDIVVVQVAPGCEIVQKHMYAIAGGKCIPPIYKTHDDKYYFLAGTPIGNIDYIQFVLCCRPRD